MPIPQQNNQVVQRWWKVWLWSLAINTALAMIDAVLTYYTGRSEGSQPEFGGILIRGLISFWIYGLLTPPVLWLCFRYPIDRKDYLSRVPLHFGASLIFTAVHVL